MTRIRAAIPSDLPELRALIERAYRGEPARAGWTHEADLVSGPRIARAELAAALADPAVRLLVADGVGDLAGCVQVTGRGGGLAYLGLLTVDPGRQAGGLGRRLLAAGEAAGLALGASVVEMTVIDGRAELIAWYERRGYRATGERRPFPVATDRPLEFVVLAKEL